MFSKSLFKQSCKASGTMWGIVTVAVCFMLACVMLITGGGNIALTKNAIQDTIIEGELNSQMQSRALNYYMTACRALHHFDDSFKKEVEDAKNDPEVQSLYASTYLESYTAAKKNGKTEEEAKNIATSSANEKVIAKVSPEAYKKSIISLTAYTDKLISDKGYAKDSNEALEIVGNIFMILNPITENGTYMQDEFYIKNGEQAPRYDLTSLFTVSDEARRVYRQEYAAYGAAIFMAGNIIEEENVNKIIDVLSSFGVTHEKYEEFGFNQYGKVKNIAAESIVDFRANYAYRMKNMKEGETEESIVTELATSISSSLLATLPQEVADALQEVGQADLYGTLVGSIFFKMAGLLLPIIYLIMTANSLIAGQVDRGSMAYVLSSSVKRRTVTFTQSVFLVGSLFAMFCLTTITSLICLTIVDADTSLTYGKLILINLGAFLVMFAMSGICFLTSCWFNHSKRSMGIGGGINMFFLVATMLGLFGSSVLPSILRMDSLNAFNYVSIISLFDVESIIAGELSYIWKFGILVVIGLVCYFIGTEKFARKDLPL